MAHHGQQRLIWRAKAPKRLAWRRLLRAKALKKIGLAAPAAGQETIAFALQPFLNVRMQHGGSTARVRGHGFNAIYLVAPASLAPPLHVTALKPPTIKPAWQGLSGDMPWLFHR